MSFNAYFLLSFGLTFSILLRLPTKMSPLDNLIGSFLVALFGFVLWPLAIAVSIKTHLGGKQNERCRD